METVQAILTLYQPNLFQSFFGSGINGNKHWHVLRRFRDTCFKASSEAELMETLAIALYPAIPLSFKASSEAELMET